MANDNCDPDVSVAYSDSVTAGVCADELVIEREWTATDNCGNKATCDHTITIEDTGDPEITCPSDVMDRM